MVEHHSKELTEKLLKHCEQECKSTEAGAKDNKNYNTEENKDIQPKIFNLSNMTRYLSTKQAFS